MSLVDNVWENGSFGFGEHLGFVNGRGDFATHSGGDIRFGVLCRRFGLQLGRVGKIFVSGLLVVGCQNTHFIAKKKPTTRVILQQQHHGHAACCYAEVPWDAMGDPQALLSPQP